MKSPMKVQVSIVHEYVDEKWGMIRKDFSPKKSFFSERKALSAMKLAEEKAKKELLEGGDFVEWVKVGVYSV